MIMDSSDISPSTLQNLERGADESGVSTERVKIGKNDASKEGHSILNSVNKSTLQIKKPPRRRTSPLNWFPRRKTDSFLKRKIKLIQEGGGMSSTLDETLGDSHPHYSRLEREKIAAREAANKAMEAHKSAMVEKSWCRILQAARIPSKEAEHQLKKAEERVAEAFNEAAAMGVIMYDKPDCLRKPFDVETSSITEEESIHSVAASFETAFEVDKEVAAAVKTAFIQLANCPNSSNKKEFNELLCKISQNPGLSEQKQETSELESHQNCESNDVPDCNSHLHFDGSSSNDHLAAQSKDRRMHLGHGATKGSKSSSKGLIGMMFDRLQKLQEEELASLATIVATCGLNAVLEEERNKQQDSVSTTNCAVFPANGAKDIPQSGAGSRKYSSVSFVEAEMKKAKEVAMELPSLDKFLVKHVSKLEKEVQEAKDALKRDKKQGNGNTCDRRDECLPEGGMETSQAAELVTDLQSILVRHKSKFEKEIEAAKKSQKALDELQSFSHEQHLKQDFDDRSKFSDGFVELAENINYKQKAEKENMDFNKPPSGMAAQTEGISLRIPPNKHLSRIERAKLEALESFAVCNESNSLDRILLKSMHRLEREKMQAVASMKDHADSRGQKKQQQGTEVAALDSLDKILVKHSSKLEKEKMAEVPAKREALKAKDKQLAVTTERQSLDMILVKHPSGHEKDKLVASQHPKDDGKYSESRREARERELQEAWGGLSLGNSIRPRLSRLEREKAAWTKAEEEEKRRAMELA